MKTLLKELMTSVVATLSLGFLVCGAYPVLVWGAAQLFSQKANGSLIVKDGQVVGSSLIGQHFSSDRYFASRPSSVDYDAKNSGGSNYGPLSQKLVDAVKDNVAAYRKQNGLDDKSLIPADAALASASGLDPHISVQNALIQLPRVAKARGMREAAVKHLLEENTEGRDLGILGEPRVNVLLLNRALDGYLGKP